MLRATGMVRVLRRAVLWTALAAAVALPVHAQAPDAAPVTDAEPVADATAATDATEAIGLPPYVGLSDAGEIILTPETAAQWAAERNTQVRIQEETIPEAEGRLRQADAADELTVDLSGSAIFMGPVSEVTLPGPEGEEPATFQVSPDQQYQATISAMKPLYTGGRTGLGEDIAREGIDIARAGTDIARLSVAQGARAASYGVLRAVQLAGVAAAQVTALAEHVSNAEALEEAGVVAHFDVVQARTELARAQEQLITAQTAIEQVKAQLRQLLALPQECPLQIVDPPPPGVPAGELPELIDLAQADRPEVQTSEIALRMAELNRKLAGRSRAASVALTGSYSRQSSGAGLSSNDYNWQVGVVAEKPIFDSGRKRGEVITADAQVAQAELELQQSQEQVALEVVQAWLAVQEAEERIVTANQGLVEARERRRMAQLRYREGLAAGIEVIDADTALAAAEASLVNAEYDRQLAVTRLRSAMGISVAEPQQEVEGQ